MPEDDAKQWMNRLIEKIEGFGERVMSHSDFMTDRFKELTIRYITLEKRVGLLEEKLRQWEQPHA